MDFRSLPQAFQFKILSAMCLQMKVLEEPTDVMGSALRHNEFQKIGIRGFKSTEKPGVLGGLFSSCNVYLVAWSSATCPFIHLAGMGKFSIGLYSQDCCILSSQK